MSKEPAAAIRGSVGVMPENAGFYEWMTAPAYLHGYGRLYGETQTDRDLMQWIRQFSTTSH